MAFCSLTALMRINHIQPIFRVPEYAELSIHTGVRRAIRSGGGLALETARELQNALLPQQYPRFPSSALPEASALRFHHFFRPSSPVGGDFFQVWDPGTGPEKSWPSITPASWAGRSIMSRAVGYGSKKNEEKNTRYRCTRKLKKRSIFGLNART